ncbi:MAG: polynucleotide adenylyltransferase PcnB [Kiritimatiellia bacterium]
MKRSDHGVSRKNIDRDALYVMQHLNRNGFKAYLVGGSVRDLMLGRMPKDFDISTDAEPQQIRRLFRNCFLVGRRFRLAHIRFGRDKVIETSTFRRQPEPNQSEESLVQWDDNQFGTPEEDAFRRDFTINGLFYDLHDFSVIDHVGGLPDLKRKLIRTIGDPNIRFREDPVRMVRAVRFAGRLGFRLESRTRRAILKHADEVLQSSPARLLDEMYKLFAFSSSAASFRSLWDLGLMQPLLPEIAAYVKATGGRKSPLWSCLGALDRWSEGNAMASPELLLAVLLHGPMLQACRAADACRHPNVVCTEWLEPFALRFRMPKGVRYRVLRLVENQIRLEQLVGRGEAVDMRRKGVLRMLEHASFPDSLALLRIRCASGAVLPEVVSFWEESVAQAPARILDASGGEVQAPDRPRRRRRRRRRRPSHEA